MTQCRNKKGKLLVLFLGLSVLMLIAIFGVIAIELSPHAYGQEDSKTPVAGDVDPNPGQESEAGQEPEFNSGKGLRKEGARIDSDVFLVAQFHHKDELFMVSAVRKTAESLKWQLYTKVRFYPGNVGYTMLLEEFEYAYSLQTFLSWSYDGIVPFYRRLGGTAVNPMGLEVVLYAQAKTDTPNDPQKVFREVDRIYVNIGNDPEMRWSVINPQWEGKVQYREADSNNQRNRAAE